MGNKKPVLRRCVACNEQKDKKELIRIVKPKEEEMQIDFTGKKNGRGAYICKKEECFKKVIKSKKLERVFETEVKEEFYESLRGIILG